MLAFGSDAVHLLVKSATADAQREAERPIPVPKPCGAGTETLGACAAPLALSAYALGNGTRPSPGNRITIGVIDTGRQSAYANIPGFLPEPDAQIVAVCDVDAWPMAKAKKQIEDFYAKPANFGSFNGCAMFRDWRDLTVRNDIDAVMIATPDHWHVIQAIAALKAGNDVACEKPLTRNIAEGHHLESTETSEAPRESRRCYSSPTPVKSNCSPLFRASGEMEW